jgi:saccharopine dehydrogenase-like NADP-dependent oxidoreductase
MKTILFLGGYGNTGKATVKALLSYFKQSSFDDKSSEPLKLLIAGRHESRATAFIQELSRYDALPARVTLEGRSVDASDVDSLKRTLEADDIDLMVVVSPTTKSVSTVAQAVLDARTVDYFDVQYSQSKTAYLTSLQHQDKINEQLWITDGGFHPGLPGAMIRFICDQENLRNEGSTSIETVNVCSLMYCDWNSLQATLSDETMEEFALEMMNFNGKVYQEGEWKDLGMGAYTNPIQVDFGEPYGTKACVPMYLNELKDLPNQYPSLQNVGFYIAGFHWVIDWLIIPFLLVMLTVFPFAK